MSRMKHFLTSRWCERDGETKRPSFCFFYAPSIFQFTIYKAFGSTNTASTSPVDWLCAKQPNLRQNSQLIEITRAFLNSGARFIAHCSDDPSYRLIKIYALQTRSQECNAFTPYHSESLNASFMDEILFRRPFTIYAVSCSALRWR